MRLTRAARKINSTSSVLENEQKGILNGRSVVERFSELPFNIMNLIEEYSSISCPALPLINKSLNAIFKTRVSLNPGKGIIDEILRLWAEQTSVESSNYSLNRRIANLLPRIACSYPEESLAIAREMLAEKRPDSIRRVGIGREALWQVAQRLSGRDYAAYRNLLPTLLEVDQLNRTSIYLCLKIQMQYDLDQASRAFEKFIDQLDDPVDGYEALIAALPSIARQNPEKALQLAERIKDPNLQVVGFARIVMASPQKNQEKAYLICERATHYLGNQWSHEETLLTRLELAEELLPIDKDAALSLLKDIEDAIGEKVENSSLRNGLRALFVNNLTAYEPERAYQQLQLIDDAVERNFCLTNSISKFARKGHRWDIALTEGLKSEDPKKTRFLAEIAKEDLGYDGHWKSKLIKILKNNTDLFEEELSALNNPQDDFAERALKRLVNADRIIRDFVSRFHSLNEAVLHLATERALRILSEDRRLGESLLLLLVPVIAKRDIDQAIELNNHFPTFSQQTKVLMKIYSAIQDSCPVRAHEILTDVMHQAYRTEDESQRLDILLTIAEHISL